jgi:hypothetical protein
MPWKLQGSMSPKYKIFAFAGQRIGGRVRRERSPCTSNEAVFFNSLLSLTSSIEMIVASVIGGMGDDRWGVVGQLFSARRRTSDQRSSTLPFNP